MLVAASCGFAQQTGFIFHTLDKRDGLRFNQCNTLLKDSRGLLWVGTYNGLNLYDGVNFFQFNAWQNSSSFINHSIYDLCEDKSGNIWGATSRGIFCYRLASSQFENFIPPAVDYARQVKNIICDQDGDIWATGEWSLLKLNKKENRFEEAAPFTQNKDSVQLFAVKANGLSEDPAGKGLWLATRLGLHFFNKTGKKFISFRNKSSASIFTSHSTAALTYTGRGYFWFFDNVTHELIAFDAVTHKVLHRYSIAQYIPDAIGQTVFEDKNNLLWVSTWNYKMLVIDYRQNKVIPLAHNSSNPLSIAGNHFWDAWEDEDNNVWLANAGGISICNYSKNVFSIESVADKIKEFADDKFGAFSIDPGDNSWWIASEKKPSVVHYFPVTGQYTYYDFSRAAKNKAGQLPGAVHGIQFMDSQPYACTHNGVWRLDKSSNKVLPFEMKFNGLPFIPYYLFVQRGDLIWFSSGKGFIKWNKNTNEAKLVNHPDSVLKDGQEINYRGLYFDNKQRGWFIAAFGWLANINEKEEMDFNYYVKDNPRDQSGYVVDMEVDQHDNLWIGTYGTGLYQYNTKTGGMNLFAQAEGVNPFIKNLALDRQGRVWMAAFNRFSILKPVSSSVSSYQLPIYDNMMDYNNYLDLSADGSVISTLNRDIIRFIPDRLDLKPEIKPPVLSMIKIAGKEKLLHSKESLSLKPDENSLEFNFGSLINTEVFPYTIEYRLDGFDREWITATTTGKAIYSNLRPGRYVFRLKVVSKNKLWETPERKITLRISTPFYRAWWFWSIIGGILTCIIILSYRFRLNKQKQILNLETKAQTLEKEKTLVQFENLKQHLNPHFLFNSLTSLSGLIEADQKMATNFLNQMSKIYRYILKNRESETVLLKEEIEFVKWYIHLQQTRFGKGLQVHFRVEDEMLDRKIAPVTLQNMVENAIKHNIVDVDSPLVIDIETDHEYIIIRNNLQKKRMVETSNQQGLANLHKLYRYLTSRPILIEETEKNYQIKIPLI